MTIALFTDTFCDANGVSRFLQDICAQSKKEEKTNGLYILTSTNKTRCDIGENIFNFKPVFSFKMPFYPELSLAIPPVFAIYKKFKELNPDIVHISTPGFIGLFGLLFAKLKRKKIVGTYHTDFPEYIFKNTKNIYAKNISIWLIRQFYKSFSIIFLRSYEYKYKLTNEIKIEQNKLKILSAGIDLNKFNPKYHDRNIWENYNLDKDSLKVLYVGRLTKEKNFLFLIAAWGEFYKKYIQTLEINAQLIVVGEGLYSKDKDKLKNQNIYFLGHKDKEELSKIYASSDLFIFPSITETLGQVVMEAQASGLMVFVANKGGQIHIANPDGSQILGVEEEDLSLWCQKMALALKNQNLLNEIRVKNPIFMEQFAIKNSFEDFWETHFTSL